MTESPNLVCKSCGAHLPVMPTDLVVRCEYCGMTNAVPREVQDLFAARPVPAPEPLPDYGAAARAQAAADAQAAAAVARAVTDAAARQVTAGVARAGSAAASRLVGCIVVVVGFTIAAGAFFAVVATRSASPGPVTGGSAPAIVQGPLGDDVVAPSWKSADGLAVARNVEARLRSGWSQAAKCEAVQFIEVLPNGTMDLTSENAMVAIHCYDASKLEGLVPGQTSVPAARYLVSASRSHLGAIETDASISSFQGATFVTSWPSCDLATLRKKAAAAGWPEGGFATVQWPSIPHVLTLDSMATELLFVKRFGKELQALIAAEGWDTGPYEFYGYGVPGYGGPDLPSYFSPADCEPVDPGVLQKKAMDALLERCDACRKASTTKKGAAQ